MVYLVLFLQKNNRILAYLKKKHYFCSRNEEDSRIRQSESSDNRTRRHPVDLLAGHFFIDSNEQSEATHDRRTNPPTPFKGNGVQQ